MRVAIIEMVKSETEAGWFDLIAAEGTFNRSKGSRSAEARRSMLGTAYVRDDEQAEDCAVDAREHRNWVALHREHASAQRER